MTERCLSRDFELRGQTYEVWSDDRGDRFLIDPRKNEEVDTDRAFDPPLTNDELLSIYDYRRDFR